ncbi:MAG: hypothetical protein QW383_03745 [Candidatus Nitrosocaldus sp.]
MMITLIIAEASLELVPDEIAWHSAVKKHAKRQGREPKEILLDRSYHHTAMLNLKDAYRRGRPDIVHFSLLEATSIPLYYTGMLNIYVHTRADKVISIGKKDVRLPKNYNRFVGLMEDLFSKGKIEDENRHLLLKVEDIGFGALLDRIEPSAVIGLSRLGEMKGAEYVAGIVKDIERTCIVVGGFPKGTFSPSIRNRFDHIISISKYSLEAHVVVARVLYEVEKTLIGIC